MSIIHKSFLELLFVRANYLEWLTSHLPTERLLSDSSPDKFGLVTFLHSMKRARQWAGPARLVRANRHLFIAERDI